MEQLAIRNRLVARSVAARYRGFLALGGLLTLVGLVIFALSCAGPTADRAWQLLHVNWLFFTGLAGGSIAFVAVQKITKAKWSGVIIRFAEAVTAFLPVSFVGFLLIFSVGYEHIYPEMHGLPHAKEVWLSHTWMFWRLFFGLLLLYYLGYQLIKADLLADVHAAKAATSGLRRRVLEWFTSGYDGSLAAEARTEERLYRLAPTYVVVYALVFTLVAFDCIMALQPHWYSNLLGGFFFMGSFLGAHTLLALTMLYGGGQLGISSLISGKQRHDLGKLCFGFTVFWTYLMWSQFLVIWYGNMPEETGFVFARLWGPWLPVGRAVLLGMFIIPFWGLLFVATKKNRYALALFATVSLSSLWLERYLLVLPSVTAEAGPTFGLPELGATLLLVGLFLLAYAVFARTFPMISPRLAAITLERERGHQQIPIFEHEERPEDYVSEDVLERRHHPR